jgi:hypothetical protein
MFLIFLAFFDHPVLKATTKKFGISQHLGCHLPDGPLCDSSQRRNFGIHCKQMFHHLSRVWASSSSIKRLPSPIPNTQHPAGDKARTCECRHSGVQQNQYSYSVTVSFSFRHVTERWRHCDACSHPFGLRWREVMLCVALYNITSRYLDVRVAPSSLDDITLLIALREGLLSRREGASDTYHLYHL